MADDYSPGGGRADVVTTAALTTHESAATAVHGIADTDLLARINTNNEWAATQTFTTVAATTGLNVSGGNVRLGTTTSLSGLYGTLVARPAAIADASTAHALNIVFSDVEVEAALNALGAKLNTVIAALRTTGVIAT